jgi:aminodeoxyfutalosine synthase
MQEIARKVYSNERLMAEEGLRLLESNDILFLGQLADFVCRKKHGGAVYYSTNLNINPTNVCVLTCKFCAFARRPGEEGEWTYSVEEIIHKVKQAAQYGLNEVHIVGGLHPKLKIVYFEDIIRRIKEINPDIHVKAFTAVEIDYFSKINRLSVEEVLVRLKSAGLDTLPGGGAEIFSERVRKLLCPTKITGAEWLEVMRTAHRLGIWTNATMLYGHIETKEEIIEHLLALRELQDQTGGFNAFVPLAFHPEHTDMVHLPPTTGYEDVKIFAVSRLMLDNFDHIKGLWTYLGDKMAQVLLYFGVDDLGGTLLEERIVHMAGANVPDGLGEKTLVQLIESVGRRTVRTDSSYKIRSQMSEDRKQKHAIFSLKSVI